MSTLKLEVGKTYRARDRHTDTIVCLDPRMYSQNVFCGRDGFLYTETGRFREDSSTSSFDLVEEIVTGETK